MVSVFRADGTGVIFSVLRQFFVDDVAEFKKMFYFCTSILGRETHLHMLAR